jgi:hypothetical protein
MGDEKDRLREKLHQKEKAEENRFFVERDKAAVERLRARKRESQQQKDAGAHAHTRCPKCGSEMAMHEHVGVKVEECPACGGMWLDKGGLEEIASRERNSWLGRLFYRPRR